jgi:hypothetical protein
MWNTFQSDPGNIGLISLPTCGLPESDVHPWSDGVDGHLDPRRSDLRAVAEIGAAAKVAACASPA